MQLSRFVVTYDSGQEDEHILYNVLSDRYAGVNDATLELLRRFDAGELPTDHDEVEIARELESQGFVVEGREVDDRRLREHLASVAQGIPGTMYVTLMPTLRCNLACTYCFQNEHPTFNSMEAETEEATLEFILRKVDEAATPKLVVCYFGGEPLTRKDFVLRTAKVLHTSMAARGGTFGWEIITNGVNLDRPFVEELKRFGDGWIKITLDGDKETHDQARVFHNGKGSFDVILANLAEVASHVRLVIGGNYFPDQEESYMRLVQRLQDMGIASKLEGIGFKPVEDTVFKPAEDIAAAEKGSCAGCRSGAKEESESIVRIGRLLRKKNLGSTRNLVLDKNPAPCELHWDNSFTVDPDGLVYKCPVVAGRSEVAVGSVSGGALREAPLVELRPWEQCGDCAYLPICVGGCLGSQYLKTGRRDQVSCKKEVFEATFRERIPRRYLEELGAAAWVSAQEAPPAGRDPH